MYNIPDDVAYDSFAPWNEPDQDTITISVCWACEGTKEECNCLEGFDPMVIEVKV